MHCTFMNLESREYKDHICTTCLCHSLPLCCTEIGFSPLAFKKGSRAYRTYRRDVLNRICSCTKWIAVDTEQYENMKSKYVYDECATKVRLRKLLCTFKLKADSMLNMMMPQERKKPDTIQRLKIILGVNRWILYDTNTNQTQLFNIYLLRWGTGYQLTIRTVTNEELKSTTLLVPQLSKRIAQGSLRHRTKLSNTSQYWEASVMPYHLEKVWMEFQVVTLEILQIDLDTGYLYSLLWMWKGKWVLSMETLKCKCKVYLLCEVTSGYWGQLPPTEHGQIGHSSVGSFLPEFRDSSDHIDGLWLKMSLNRTHRL